ncbi:MAG: FAD-dependent oxidoreductase [Chloroflexota bacterium]|nr:FAD-dependent oxidoreductase [Chloroflexota bacterium]
MKTPTGAALVYGAGIAGIQAALDLANTGIKVYLADQDISIGGNMTRLDKTFPTNDCATCIVAPKLVEASRHPNIEIITQAQLEGVSGEAGHFQVRLDQASRYIRADLCNGCGDCANACPVVVPNRFDLGLSTRKAVYRHSPQAVPNAFAIEKKGTSPCRTGCPVGVNVQGFISLLAQGKFREALDLYKQRNPFPATMGRICHHPCELACHRGKVDQPLASRALHRFLADWEQQQEIRTVTLPEEAAKVAIIGSGPAGLTCAWDLAHRDYRPTVFEALPVVGGMLRVGIPRYRLPEEVLQREIDAIARGGVEIRTNTPIGPDLTLNDLFAQGYKAIFIAIGKHKSRRLNIEGEHLLGVIHGVDFLREVKAGKPADVAGKTVAIIGGGNTAVDAARTCLRLGAQKVRIVYRRTRPEMPANEDEITACEEEGVEIVYLAAPTKILGEKGAVTGLECVRMKLGEPDSSGRRRPIPVDGSGFTIEAQVVVPAVSQDADLSFLGEVKGLEVTKGGILPTEGIELEGVRGFTDFLRAASLGEKVELGERVIVIGGGIAAVDVARTALRMGAKDVHLACLERKHEITDFKEEVDAAEEEGVSIHAGLAPKRIIGEKGRAKGVEFVECVSMFDSQGQFHPRFREGTARVLPADTVIVAIGQIVDWTLLRAADGVLETKAGTIKVDPITFASNVPGIFAGGDVVDVGEGELALVAIRHGHEAAVSIDRYVRGEDMRAGREIKPEIQLADLPKERTEIKPRVTMPMRQVATRVRTFEEVELGYTAEQAVEEAKRCLACGVCSECLSCVTACGMKAIDHAMPPRTIQLDVGGIILAAGFDLFEAQAMGEYGHGRYPNVVSSLEFERVLSASGPYEGHVRRPSDATEPKRIAFIQCVGSRNLNQGNDYCSAVCCMYATKEAIVAKEHLKGLEATIFYIDLRAYGKGFYRYYQRAKDEYGIRYVRSMISSVKEMSQTKNLLLKFVADDGRIREEEFDLVVLSAGLKPSPKTADLCDRLGISTNRHGFCATQSFSPVQTSRPGIYACGTITGPKDIPQTVMEASAAAADVEQLLSPARGTLVREKEFAAERDVVGEEPRIGAFICHCGTNIGGVVDVPAVAESARSLPGVVIAEDNLHMCAPDAQVRIKELMAEHKLNRVFVAACSPRTHEPLFQETLQEAGLNRYLFEMANIRDQCSWVHMHEPDKATQKAKDLVGMGLNRARYLTPLHSTKLDLNHRALVIGGGLAGMIAARTLAGQGFEVDLVEKENELGGNLRHLHYTLEGNLVQKFLDDLMDQVERDPLIAVHTRTRVTRVDGCVGNFAAEVTTTPGKAARLESGAIILATGAQEHKPSQYLYGQDARVLTQRELEERLATSDTLGTSNFPPFGFAQGRLPTSVVMIQCVGSRDDERPYCSRVCCSQALKNALKLKEISPDIEVSILYRDLMSYGLKEEYYTKARKAGVKFIRYEVSKVPEVKVPEVSKVASAKCEATIAPGSDNSALPTLDTSHLQVRVVDAGLHRTLDLPADLVVLSVPTVAPKENQALAQTLKVPLDSDGFFLEAHMKLRPVDFATDGIFVCGLAHGPKFMEETVVQAQAAAGRAATILSQKQIESQAIVPNIDLDKCIGCRVCEALCTYQAIKVQETPKGKKAQVLLAACKGCGACSVACPRMANMLSHFTDAQLLAQIKALGTVARFSKNGFEPKILGFLCNWCAYAGADLAGSSRISYQPNFHTVRVMCSGRVDPALVVEAYLQGIDGVMVLGCHPGDCHYAVGNYYARDRMAYLQRVLEQVGLDARRFKLDWVSASEGSRFAEVVNAFSDQVRALGPIG